MKSKKDEENAKSSKRTRKSKTGSHTGKTTRKTGINKTKEPVSLKETIDWLLNQNTSKVFSIKDIFKELQFITEEEKLKAVQILEKMENLKQVIRTKEGKFKGNAPRTIITGVVDFVNPRFAFIVSEEITEDIWVNADDLLFALDGDIVKVVVYPQKGDKKKEGKVIEIIERKRKDYVGKIEISDKYAFVVADSKKMHIDIFVPKDKINGAKNGYKVIVKIVEWQTQNSSPVGVVKEVLGKAGENNTEMHAILAEYDLPNQFSEEILEEAERIPAKITDAEIKKRQDFRKITTFTIDPEDAKDFDDALSFRKLENGNIEIGIHIADVTHYLKTGTRLDKEAYERGTSVYLVDRVVSMLPERLSNNLCSLRPKEDKLTFSAVFQLDENAQVVKEWFGKTIIHSDKRFSYEAAQAVIETGEGDFAEELKTLNTLAKKLNAERFKKGAINFETTEVKFKLDQEGKPIGIYIKERKDAHKLIEEFMLLANRRVATFVFNKSQNDHENTMVYRTHDKPNEEKLQNFSNFAKKFGFEIAIRGKEMATSMNKMTQSIEGTAQQNVLQSLAIRTMAKAKYTTESSEHFGLAFDHYTHFTSPIRRYPDMMVHSLLEHYLKGGKSPDQNEFEQKCKHSSDMEKKAADAERASIKYKQVEYMQNMEDKVFDGVITGVTEWGFYVEIVETKCEGMVRMSDLLDDFYELDADNYRIIGKRNKNVLGFGDSVKVKVKATNLEKRTMDLLLA